MQTEKPMTTFKYSSIQSPFIRKTSRQCFSKLYATQNANSHFELFFFNRNFFFRKLVLDSFLEFFFSIGKFLVVFFFKTIFSKSLSLNSFVVLIHKKHVLEQQETLEI